MAVNDDDLALSVWQGRLADFRRRNPSASLEQFLLNHQERLTASVAVELIRAELLLLPPQARKGAAQVYRAKFPGWHALAGDAPAEEAQATALLHSPLSDLSLVTVADRSSSELLDTDIGPASGPGGDDSVPPATDRHAPPAVAGKTSVGPGVVLGNYEVLATLGRGGMGQVFKAIHRRLQRTVALKILNPSLQSDPDALKRFQREMQVLSRLSHPNVVMAYDADEAFGVHFLAMEYVEGIDLQQLVMERGPLPLNQALDFVWQAARGLDYGHQQGVIHRDVKPSNLLLDQQGVVKVLDLGLARVVAGAEPGGTASEFMTETGMVMGTADFMSPEQAVDSRLVDRRSDIYSLGCTLYFLLTGIPLYGGDTPMLRLLAHREQPLPQLAETRPGLPPGLQPLFERMVAKRQEDRYASLAELMQDLERNFSAAPSPLPVHPQYRAADTLVVNPASAVRRNNLPPPTQVARPIPHAARSRSNWWIGTAGVVLLLALAAGWLSRREPEQLAKALDPAPSLLSDAHSRGAVAATKVNKALPAAAAVELPDGGPAKLPDPAPVELEPVDFAAERRAAQWVLDVGGLIELHDAAGNRATLSDRKLPEQEFVLVYAHVPSHKTVRNADLAILRPCRRLQYLRLNSRQLTDEALTELQPRAPLRGLDLGSTSITDAALTALLKVSTLRSVAVPQTLITDAGLQEIGRAGHMDGLTLGSQATTSQGIAAAVMGNRELRELFLAAEAPDNALHGLAKHPGLARVIMNRSLLDESAAEVLQSLPRLAELALNPPWSDQTFDNLARITALPRLDLHDFRGQGLTRAQLGKLAAMPALTNLYINVPAFDDNLLLDSAALPKLRQLQVSARVRPTLSAAGLARFSELRPDVRVSVGYGDFALSDPNADGSLLRAAVPFGAAQAVERQAAWAESLGVPVEFSNSLGMKFRLIPPGEFSRGSSPKEIARALAFHAGEAEWQEYVNSESPPHLVILRQPIYLSVTEVTQQAFAEIMGRNPSLFSPTGPDSAAAKKVAGLNTANFPVDDVGWNAAAEFCTRLSEREQRQPCYSQSGETVTILPGDGYRLPTEAEWEFACRAGTTSRFSAGNDDHELVRTGWMRLNAAGRTHAVGGLTANAFGLYDMHGNVREWCQDLWQANSYAEFAERPALDPAGPPAGDRGRIHRGGSFDASAAPCRSASRAAALDGRFGFRVALPVQPNQNPEATAPRR